MILDNFDLFEKYILDFGNNPGDPYVYQVEIIERKKDGVKTSGANNAARRIASYFIETKEQWDKLKPRIKDLCDARSGARAYINPSHKRSSRCLTQLNMELAERFQHGAFTGIAKILDTSVAKTKPGKDESIWILDLDPDDSFFTRRDEIAEMIKDSLIARFPSKNGEHLLTTPFNREQFKKDFIEKFGEWKEDDLIKINALTNLYFNNTGLEDQENV